MKFFAAGPMFPSATADDLRTLRSTSTKRSANFEVALVARGPMTASVSTAANLRVASG